jgi:hypothetical protein
LDRLETSGLGLKIGNISVSNTACADDIAMISETPNEAQRLVNMVTDFAFMEGYQLQPTKSVVINVSSKKNQTYNRYPSMNAKSVTMLTSLCASFGVSLIRAISSAHAVLLMLMLPISKPNLDVSSLSKSGLIQSL